MPPRAAATLSVFLSGAVLAACAVRNRARRAGVGRHRDPARRADPGHARGGRPGASLGHGLSARWRHPHHRTPRQSAAAAHSRRPVRALERRTQGGRAGQGGLLDVALSPDFAKDRRSTCPMPRPATAAPAPWDAAVWPMTGPAWRISASCSGRSPSCPRGCISVPAGAGRQRASLHRAGREQPALHRARPGQAAGQGGAHPPTARCRRTILRGQGRRAPEIWSYGHRNPQGMALNPWSGELWESEHARRRRGQSDQAGAELRLAPGDLRHRLFRPAHPRGAWPDAAGHGVAAVLVAEVARHQRHGVLRRAQVSGGVIRSSSARWPNAT